MTAKDKQPPAKARYDLKNPRVTFRLPKEYTEKLDSLSTARGISHTDFMKGVLNGKEQEISHDGGYDEDRKDGYNDGYGEGWSEGYNKGWWEREEAVECYYLTCQFCGRRFVLSRARIQKVVLGSINIQCPFCAREYWCRLINYRGLEEACHLLGVMGV